MSDWRFRISFKGSDELPDEPTIDALIDLEYEIDDLINERLEEINEEFGTDFNLVDEDRDVNPMNLFLDPNTPIEERIIKEGDAAGKTLAKLRSLVEKLKKEKARENLKVIK